MPAIEDDDVVTHVERLPTDAVDELPFGVIRLDADGRVIYLSQTEARQSGLGDRLVTGRAFFTDLAPCMWTSEFQQRFEAAAAGGTLDVTFDQVGDFDDPGRQIRVRARSASGGGFWVFIDRRA